MVTGKLQEYVTPILIPFQWQGFPFRRFQTKHVNSSQFLNSILQKQKTLAICTHEGNSLAFSRGFTLQV